MHSAFVSSTLAVVALVVVVTLGSTGCVTVAEAVVVAMLKADTLRETATERIVGPFGKIAGECAALRWL